MGRGGEKRGKTRQVTETERGEETRNEEEGETDNTGVGRQVVRGRNDR